LNQILSITILGGAVEYDEQAGAESRWAVALETRKGLVKDWPVAGQQEGIEATALALAWIWFSSFE
jgi:hypothetical protein